MLNIMKFKTFFLAIITTVAVGKTTAQTRYSSNDGMLHVDLKKALDIALDENPTIRVAEKSTNNNKVLLESYLLLNSLI